MADSKKEESKTKYIYMLLAAIVVVASFFIPFPKETFLDDDSRIDTFTDIAAYRVKLYKTTYSIYDGHASYHDTGDIVTVLKLLKPDCNTRSTGYGIASDCEDLYIHNGKVYDNLRFDDEYANTKSYKYLDEVSYKETYDSGIDYETYYTVNCYMYGLVCTSGNTVGDYKDSHARLHVGNKAKIKFYRTTCDLQSGREMLNGDVCIYADDTYDTISFQDLLKK